MPYATADAIGQRVLPLSGNGGPLRSEDLPWPRRGSRGGCGVDVGRARPNHARPSGFRAQFHYARDSITWRFDYGRPHHATCPREGWSKDPEHIIANHASENAFLDAEMTRVMG